MMRLEKELEGMEIVERVEEERWEELNNYMKVAPGFLSLLSLFDFLR